jgi:hypothetical protein
MTREAEPLELLVKGGGGYAEQRGRFHLLATAARQCPRYERTLVSQQEAGQVGAVDGSARSRRGPGHRHDQASRGLRERRLLRLQRGAFVGQACHDRCQHVPPRGQGPQ